MNGTLAAASPVFLISAEGKNPEIIGVLQRARMHSARPVHVLMNHQTSPLMDCANTLTDISTHVFELADKDGYLATNSLLLNAVLAARAYGELDNDADHVPALIDGLRLGDQTIDQWLIRLALSRPRLVLRVRPMQTRRRPNRGEAGCWERSKWDSVDSQPARHYPG